MLIRISLICLSRPFDDGVFMPGIRTGDFPCGDGQNPDPDCHKQTLFVPLAKKFVGYGQDLRNAFLIGNGKVFDQRF